MRHEINVISFEAAGYEDTDKTTVTIEALCPPSEVGETVTIVINGIAYKMIPETYVYCNGIRVAEFKTEVSVIGDKKEYASIMANQIVNHGAYAVDLETRAQRSIAINIHTVTMIHTGSERKTCAIELKPFESPKLEDGKTYCLMTTAGCIYADWKTITNSFVIAEHTMSSYSYNRFKELKQALLVEYPDVF